jgi:hypothetical protein
LVCSSLNLSKPLSLRGASNAKAGNETLDASEPPTNGFAVRRREFRVVLAEIVKRAFAKGWANGAIRK